MSDAGTNAPERLPASGAATEGDDAAGENPVGETAAAPADEHHHRQRRIPVRTHRVRTAVVAGVIVVVALALPFLVVKATRTVANSKAGKTVTPTGPTATELPDTPAALLVIVGPDHQVAGLVVLAQDGSGKGGTAIVVPAGMDVAGPAGSAPSRLGDAYATGGLDAQRQAVESALGITTSSAIEVDESELTALLEPYAPIRLTLTDRALDTGANGKETVMYPPGPVELTAAEAAHLLVAKGPNESEISRLSRIGAIWDAVVKHESPTAASSSAFPATTAVPTTTPVAAPSTTSARATSSTRSSRSGRTTTSVAPSTTVTLVPPTTSPATVPWSTQLAAVEAGPASAQVLPGHAVLDAVGNPNGVDLIAVDNVAMRLLLAETMPGAVSPANDNIRLRLINNSGDPNLLATAGQRLVDAGANLIVVSPSGATTAQTVIEYQDPTEQGPAGTLQPVVGAAVVRQSPDRIDGIDATIILGSDFAGFLQTDQAKNGPTTSPSTSSTP